MASRGCSASAAQPAIAQIHLGPGRARRLIRLPQLFAEDANLLAVILLGKERRNNALQSGCPAERREGLLCDCGHCGRAALRGEAPAGSSLLWSPYRASGAARICPPRRFFLGAWTALRGASPC